MLFLIIPYFLFSIFLFALLIRDYRKKQFAGALSGILAFSCILYGIVPTLFVVLERNYANNIGIYGFSDLYGMVYTSVNLSSHIVLLTNYIIAIFFLLVGHSFAFKNATSRTSKKNDCFVEIKINNSSNSMRKFAIFCFFIGIFSLGVYIYALGGIKSAILKSELLRGFSSTVQVSSYLSLFKVPAALTPMSFYLLIINSESKKKSLSSLLMLIVSFAASLLFLVINASKTAIVMFAIFVVYAFFSRRSKHIWIKMFVLAFLLLLSLSILDDLFVIVSYGKDYIQNYSSEQSLLRLLRQFSYPYQIELHLNDITSQFGFLFFKNVVTDFVGLLPGVSFEQSYGATSYFFNGPDWKLISGVPNDLFSFGYLNLGYLGTAFYMFVIGNIVGLVDRSLVHYPANRFERDLLAFLFACKMFSHVNSVDIQPIIQYDLSLVLLTFVVVFVSKNTKKGFLTSEKKLERQAVL